MYILFLPSGLGIAVAITLFLVNGYKRNTNL